MLIRTPLCLLGKEITNKNDKHLISFFVNKLKFRKPTNQLNYSNEENGNSWKIK